MFRHVSLLKLSDEATDAQRQAILDGLATLPASIPAIRDYRFGFDAGLAEGNYDLAVVADFDDQAGYLAYASDPEHMEVIGGLIRPLLAGRVAVQFELPGTG